MPAIVRAREASDVERCVRLLEAVQRADGYPGRWPADPAAFLRPSGMLAAWVAVAGDAIVGHVTLRDHIPEHGIPYWAGATGLAPGRLACVSRLFVSPDRRGDGLGGALLDAASARARRDGLRPVLDVVDTGGDAIALYERRGWRRVGSVAWDAWGEATTLHYYVSPPDGAAP